MLWGYQLEFWDWLGVRLMFLGAVIGVLALFISLISAYFLYRVADTAQSELQYKTLTLGVEISSARERALILEKEAADARLEPERLKQVVAWRSISPENASQLEKVLAVKPGSVNLRYTDGDPEALFLAIQFSQTFSKAHWQVAPGALKPANAIIFGISLPDAAGADAQTLRTAFLTTGIAFSPKPVPSGTGISVSWIEGAPMLMIGSRPPPEFP